MMSVFLTRKRLRWLSREAENRSDKCGAYPALLHVVVFVRPFTLLCDRRLA